MLRLNSAKAKPSNPQKEHLALLDFLNVGRETSTPKAFPKTMIMDTGSRNSTVVGPFAVHPNERLTTTRDISYNVLASRTKEDLIKRIENTIIPQSPEFLKESTSTQELDWKKNLNLSQSGTLDRHSLMNKGPTRIDTKMRATLGSIKPMRTTDDSPKKFQTEINRGVPTNLSQRPGTNLPVVDTPHYLQFGRLQPQHRTLTQPVTKSEQPRFQFSGRPAQQPQPVNLRSLVSNMELLRVPSRVLRYNNDHMLKSLGYCFEDNSKTKVLPKPASYASLSTLQPRSASVSQTTHSSRALGKPL